MEKKHRLFLILGGFFITNTLIAEFIGVKIFSLESTLGFEPLNLKLFGVENLGFNLTVGVILWPIVFVMTDIINEYYGKKGVRMLSNMAVVLILYAFAMFYWGINLAPNEWWQFESGLRDDPAQSIADMDLAFRRIFGQGLWIIVGSLVAFLVGQIVDVLVFHRIKRFTGEGKVWMRATGSTLVSQFIDSYVVLVIAFYVGADWNIVTVLAIGTVNYIYKFLLAIVLTPTIYLGHYAIDRYLGHELATKMKEEAALSSS
jgi:uncharacterized integral membrane protein (TIGR00697 family)